jgi:hypothetical protein
MSAAAADPDRVRHAPSPLLAVTANRVKKVSESLDFTLKRNRAERVQIVNVNAMEPGSSQRGRRAAE